jgi:hypothetical protein
MRVLQRFRWVGLVLLVLVLAIAGVIQIAGQTVSNATIVQQSSQRQDAATTMSTSATSAATITLTPNAGESVYVYAIDIANCAGGTAVTAAAVTSITTTNITGSPAWTIGSGVTAGQCTQSFGVNYATGVKSTTPGTNVTFVLPTFATNQTIRLNVAWRSAP